MNDLVPQIQQLLEAKVDHENRLRTLEKDSHQMSVHLGELSKISNKLDKLEKSQGTIRISQISLTAKLAGVGFALSIMSTLLYIVVRIGVIAN